MSAQKQGGLWLVKHGKRRFYVTAADGSTAICAVLELIGVFS